MKESKGGHGRPQELLHHQPLHDQKLMVFAGAEIKIMLIFHNRFSHDFAQIINICLKWILFPILPDFH